MSSGAPTEKGVSIRYPSEALLCVNTEDARQYDNNGFRIDTNIPSSIYINKQKPLMFGYMTRVALNQINFEWDTPNINPRNSTLTLDIYSVSTTEPYPATYNGTVRIDLMYNGTQPPLSGYFATLPSLCANLKSTLNLPVLQGGAADVFGKSLVWDVACIPEQGNMTISVADALTPTVAFTAFKIMPKNRSYTGGIYPPFITGYPRVEDDLTTPLGLAVPVNPPYYTQVFSGVSPMYYTPYIDIVSALLTKNQNVADDDTSKQGRSSLLARVYLNEEGVNSRHIDVDLQTDNAVGCLPFTLKREFTNPKQIAWNTTENIDVIDIKVLDYLGNELYITPNTYTANVGPANIIVKQGNTGDFQMTFTVSEI